MRILERVLIKLGIKKRVDFNSVEYQRSRGAKIGLFRIFASVTVVEYAS